MNTSLDPSNHSLSTKLAAVNKSAAYHECHKNITIRSKKRFSPTQHNHIIFHCLLLKYRATAERDPQADRPSSG
jgi:hypothetical protein